MINKISLRNDYSFLVDQTTEIFAGNNYPLVDAIFIPFKKRHANLNELLRILNFYTGPIYLMPSEDKELKHISWDKHLSVVPLLINDHKFILFFNSLLTYIPHFREVELWNFDPREVNGRVRRKLRDPFRGVSGAASGAARA